MGVEPTVACSAQTTTSFEDWGIHRDTCTPTLNYSRGRRGSSGRKNAPNANLALLASIAERDRQRV